MADEESDLEMEVDFDDPDFEVREKFQKNIWQFRLLPYFDELKKDADAYFSTVKTGIAHSILYRDVRPGLIYWIHELDRFINLYSRRFKKTDHINLVKLLHAALTMEKLDFRVVKLISQTLTSLLCRKNLLNRTDLQLDWRPLYDLYVEISYKHLEEDGILLLPNGLKKTLGHTIQECTHFFSDNATQEILDEVRPYLCPFNDAMSRGFSLLYLFLPTALEPEQHDKFGAKLWIDEMWHWFMHASPLPVHHEKLLSLFARLAKDCPGYVDWNDKLDYVCSSLLPTFKLQVGIDGIVMDSSARLFPSLGFILVYSLGGQENIAQRYLDKMFTLFPAYLHPSNTGNHTTNLLNFIHRITLNIVNRINRERYRPSKFRHKVPSHLCLTDEQIDIFVKSLLPCLKFAAFSKRSGDVVCSIIRLLAFLSPGLIIPFVLDIVYPAIETVKEPHRLLSALGILASISVPLVTDDPSMSKGERLPIEFMDDPTAHLKSYRIHAITLLNNILPGLDVNDMHKSALTFQIIGILLILIPMVDCSDAVHTVANLTEEERELCSATASLHSFIDQLVDKSIAMLELLNNTNVTMNGHIADRRVFSSAPKTRIKNVEEMIAERGVVSVFKAITRNCTSAIYVRIFEQFYDLIKTNIFCSKTAIDTVTRCCSVIVANRPDYAFPILANFVLSKLKGVLSEEIYHEEEVDPSIIFYLTLASEIMRGIPGPILLENRQCVDELVKLILPFDKCIMAFNLVGKLCQHLLSSLCTSYQYPIDYHRINDQPLDKYLPIRNWAKTINKNKCNIVWHIPSDDEVSYASELVDLLINGSLIKLSQPDSLTQTELLKYLSIVRCSFEGCSYLCPYFEGEVMHLIPSVTPNVLLRPPVTPTSLKMLTTKDGKNLRIHIYNKMEELGDFLLLKKENDTKSSIEFVAILRILLQNRGIDQSSYSTTASGFHFVKKLLSNPLRGANDINEMVFEGQIAFIHLRRLLVAPLIGITPTHLQCFKLLIRFGTSLYSSVRIEAQRVLEASFSTWYCSYKLVLDSILEMIDPSNSYTHEQFKGALFMLLNGKEAALCVRQDWEALLKIWPALCSAKYTDKPSVIVLFDMAQDIVVNNFSSFQITYNIPESVFPLAEKLIEPYEDCIHNPVWPTPTRNEYTQIHDAEKERNDKSLKLYNRLCTELLNLSTSSKLHRRKVELAEAYLTLLLRRDLNMPDGCVQLFFRLLTSDVNKTRKQAVSMVGSWLKITKPKSLKMLHPIAHMDPNNGPGSSWPICYGYRKDNRMLLFDSRKQPINGQEWDNTRFFYKFHWGFYTWPKEFKSYAAPASQNMINRPHSEFTEIEKSVLNILNPEFFEEFVRLFSLEEKKGGDTFDPINYQFFYRLFSNFNDAKLPLILPFLEKLLEDKREGSQRLASEIVAGIITGSRLWIWEKQEKVCSWIAPRLTATLESVNAEAEANWGSCLATIYSMCDIRAVSWLTEILFSLAKKPSDNSYHGKVRLYLLHSALGQLEWRAPEYWQRLAEHSIELIDSPFKDIRGRVGSALSMATFWEFKGIYLDPEFQRDFKLYSTQRMIAALWKKAINGSESSTIGDEPADNETNNYKREKLIFVTLVNTLNSMTAMNLHNLDPCVLELIPLLAHFSNEVTEEEMSTICTIHLIRTMGLSLIEPQNIEALFTASSVVIQKASQWKSKLVLLRFLQIFIVTNIFLIEGRQQAILELLLTLTMDPQFDVRVMAADTFSGLLSLSVFTVDETLLKRAYQQSSARDPIQRHTGVLILAGIVQAYPYSVPAFLPEVLMSLCKHATDPSPIKETVKKALNEFKRTHQDCWHEHSQEFSEEQLEILTNLMVSPNYYV